MSNDKRLIEVAFPLKQTSLDSVHEKNVRHGHISTLHIWPARRPLAACRAALIATLLPDPGTPELRKALCEKIGGKVVKVVKRKKLPSGKVEDKVVEETVGGILHWGRETENKADVDWFREEIRKAYGGRAPKVLDPFAGGGAIPLEAMRLGCEVTAIDINPVAWFILKCTLEYPQKLAGQKRRLPDFALRDAEFMEEFFKAHGFKKAQIRTFLNDLGLTATDYSPPLPGMLGQNVDSSFLEADLAWHVRAWGRWVLAEARKELARFYPTYADYQPLENVEEWREKHPKLVRPMRLVPLKDDGTPDIDALNEEVLKQAFAKDKKFWGKDAESQKYRKEATEAFFKNKSNPRWVAKPTVAYLWARTVRCKNCRATIPLLKTRWLAKREKKRVLLTMEPNSDRTGVAFSVECRVPAVGGNNAQKREHDRSVGAGTMSRAGAWCPCCGKPGTVAMEMEDMRQEGLNGQLGAVMTAVVLDGPDGKEYRRPTDEELEAADLAAVNLDSAFAAVPFGVPGEPMPTKDALGIRAPLYGFNEWRKLFTQRQLFALATLVNSTRNARLVLANENYSDVWKEALACYLADAVDRVADYGSMVTHFQTKAEFIVNTFQRFALPMNWDFTEVAPLSGLTGSYQSAVAWVALVINHVTNASAAAMAPHIFAKSAKTLNNSGEFDVVLTDPPYYDAIPYSDLMDFFYVWLRRSVSGLSPSFDASFKSSLGPKWDAATDDGELIDDDSRHDGNRKQSRDSYESGMARVFELCRAALKPEGRLVIVFANKQPAAWETLVSAIIRSGFVVDGSWPIRTEMGNRTRALTSAALASSVWLVCKRRSETARPGWDNTVLGEMRSRITGQLRSFWDAGIDGPDFVWAATGPAMEAFSKHPFVKKADSPGETMSVSEFLRAVRRIVVDFVVGRVLTEATGVETDTDTAATLDDVTTYYLLHRHDFGMDDAPAGACILYAVSCNLSESDLADKYDLLVRSGGVDKDDDGEADEGDADAEGDAEEGSGSTFKLKAWKQRKRPGMGVDPLAEATRSRRLREEAQPRLIEDTQPVESAPAAPKMMPLIDQVHRLMHLWKAGDVTKVDLYLEDRGLRRSELFKQLLQALIELSPEASEERSVLESISNHVQARGMKAAGTAALPFVEIVEADAD
ncbi:MAG: DUF1156 domain-containing protein [Planctomycetia bacterium]|nr:MAG: DUF1156 domain-containing protein [Planctomycetia bacterium]